MKIIVLFTHHNLPNFHPIHHYSPAPYHTRFLSGHTALHYRKEFVYLSMCGLMMVSMAALELTLTPVPPNYSGFYRLFAESLLPTP